MNLSFYFSRIGRREIDKVRENLDEKIANLSRLVKQNKYTSPESFLSCPHDRDLSIDTENFRKKYSQKNLKTVFLVGIGGAVLGTKAIYDGMFRRGVEANKNQPKFFFFDSTGSLDQDSLEEHTISITRPEEFLVMVISKSGTTLETLMNADLVIGGLQSKFGNISSRLVLLTEENSRLWSEGFSRGVAVYPLRSTIPDRFSIFSATALYPLSLLPFNIGIFLRSAESIRNKYLKNTVSNDAIISAAVLNINFKAGIKILDSFFFVPQLESLGKWSRQLGAESLGKEEILSGRKTHVGFTPTVSIGTADLHSMLQLYLAGPKERFTQFVSVKKIPTSVIKDTGVFGELDDDLENRRESTVTQQIYKSVRESYVKGELPFSEIVLDGISEMEIAKYMMFKMMETLYLGYLWDINVFSQPNVEEYKARTHRSLGRA